MTPAAATQPRIVGPKLRLPAPTGYEPLASLEAELIASVVRRHAVGADSPAAARAHALAERALRSGASVAEACREARRVLDRWRRLHHAPLR